MQRILLADDSPHAQRMGERILREEGYDVVSVTDGEQALVRLGEARPDLVLADLFLPKRSGQEICRFIKASADFRRTPVVLTVGALETYDEEAVRRTAADGILRKPFEASVVLETIRPLLDAAPPRAAEPAALGAAAGATPAHVDGPAAQRASAGLSLVADSPRVAESQATGADSSEPSAAGSVVTAYGLPPDADHEQVRAAVTLALDAAYPTLIEEITAKVLLALKR